MWPLLTYEGILHQEASTRRAHRKRSTDLFGARAEEGAVHGSGGGLRTCGSAKKNVEAAVVAERRASADVEHGSLADFGRDRALAEIGSKRERNAAVRHRAQRSRVIGCSARDGDAGSRRPVAVYEQQAAGVTRRSSVHVEDLPRPFAHRNVGIADVVIERGLELLVPQRLIRNRGVTRKIIREQFRFGAAVCRLAKRRETLTKILDVVAAKRIVVPDPRRRVEVNRPRVP